MKLKGVVTIVPTPLKSDESFDVLGCKNIAKFLTDKNLPMFCLGSAGEGMNLPFKTRIELRQISTREEAKRIGGVGSCGRTLCCASFACDFCHVTLEHARTQQLSNNVAKLSGYCGRLKCCLLYEYEVYTDAFKNFPPMNSRLKFKEGMGHIIKADIFKDLVFVHIPKTGVYKTLTRHELNEMMSKKLVLPPQEDKKSKSGKNKFNECEDDIEELKKLEG